MQFYILMTLENLPDSIVPTDEVMEMPFFKNMDRAPRR
jgi:hypothetical protein